MMKQDATLDVSETNMMEDQQWWAMTPDESEGFNYSQSVLAGGLKL